MVILEIPFNEFLARAGFAKFDVAFAMGDFTCGRRGTW